MDEIYKMLGRGAPSGSRSRSREPRTRIAPTSTTRARSACR